MNNLLQDLRYAVRMLTKNPGFAIAAVLTIAFGIGINTALFSVVNAFLFRPLPVKDPHELVVMGSQDDHMIFPHGISYPDYLDYKKRTDIFADLALKSLTPVSMSDEGQAERVWIEAVTANYFSLLGVNPLHGRLFAIDDDRARGASPVIVLSHTLWQKRFGGDPSIVGRPIKLSGHPFTIIGVTTENFPGTESLIDVEAYVPLMAIVQIMPKDWGGLEDRDAHNFRTIARLAPDKTVEEARAAVNTIAANLSDQYPTTNKGVNVLLVPETESRPEISTGHLFKPAAGIFMFLVGLVLLIACANVANLLLVRGIARSKEIALRSALGATRTRIIRQLLTESSLIAIFGAASGLAMAFWTSEFLSDVLNAYPSDLRLRADFSIDWRVFVFTLGMALFAGIFAGLIPALRGSRPHLVEMIKEGGRSSGEGAGRHKLRNLLVVAQISVSLMLLVCAGMFFKSLNNAQNVDLGFRANNLVLMSVDPGLQGYDDNRRLQYYQQAADRVRTLPGVESASWATYVNFSGYGVSFNAVYAEGAEPVEEGKAPTAMNMSADNNYFDTIGMAITQGRPFTEEDNESSRRVAIINEAMAKEFWPGENPLGRKFRVDRKDAQPVEVVGVSKNSKYSILWEEPQPFFYLPLRQRNPGAAVLHIRSKSETSAIVAAVRGELRGLDSQMPIFDVKSIESHLQYGNAYLPFRLGAIFTGAFGFVGLALATIGIYGVISYSVTQRTQEIGIRMALGATRKDVLKMILGRGIVVIAIGVTIGCIGALALTQPLSYMLMGVSATDPVIFATVALLLALVALLACWIPALRATRVDPMVALRYE